jgi:DNA-binding Xre family transcriptional regulator
MLRYHFERILKARGIDRPYAYLTNRGIHNHLASCIRKNSVPSMTLKNLEKLCLLLHCTPNDLMEWAPDDERSADKKQPLNRLRKRDELFDMNRSLNSIPLDKLEEIGKYIDEQIREEESD